MKISVIGSGYVGLITSAGFAEKGHDMVCVDILKEKVDAINNKQSPIYEEGLDDILDKQIGKNLNASLDLKKAVLNSTVTFICVGTPSLEDGAVNLDYVKECSSQIGKALKEKNDFHVVVVKSTVIPGTTNEVVGPVIEEFSGKKAGVDFGLAMNPEFLREGIAVEDFRHPDRIVLGCSDDKSMKVLKELYSDFDSTIVETDPKTAEMIKYASNSFLATKISFINEVGNMCKQLGIDVYKVAEGMSLDKRISPSFLRAGPGFGGSCFPKDVVGLVKKSNEIGVKPVLLESVLEVNKHQPLKVVDLARKKLGSLENKKIALLGLAFKGGTDDMRESPAIPIVNQLLKEKALVKAFDPEAMENARKIFGDRIEYAKNKEECLNDAEIALIVTEWEDFKNLKLDGMKKKSVVDARRMLEPNELPKDIEYEGLSW